MFRLLNTNIPKFRYSEILVGKKELLLLSLGFLSVFFLFLRPPTDPDLFWHLRQGKIIVEEHRFPLEDEFTHTFPGYKWADSYWLSEVIFYTFYRYLGDFLGLFVLSFVFASLTTVAFYIFPILAQKSRRLEVILSTTFFGALLTFVFTGSRPQMFTAFFFSLLWLILRRVLFAGKLTLVNLIPAVFLFWANLHAGFVLGLGLLIAFNLFESARFITKRVAKKRSRGDILENFLIKDSVLESKQLKKLWGIFLLSTLVTFINPYGPFLHETILKDATSTQIKVGIQEWQAIDFHSELGLVFLLYLTLLIFVLLVNFRKTQATEALLILGFTYLAFSGLRHIPLFVSLTLPYILENFFVFSKFPQANRFVLAYFVGFFVLFSLVYGVQSTLKLYETSGDPYELAKEGDYPLEAVKYLKAKPLQGNVYNSYGWGGYLILNLPEVKVFIDGRMPGWIKGEDNIFADYRKVYYLEENFKQVFEKYRVSWVLIKKGDSLARVLEVSPEWALEYEDERAVIFVRQEAD